MVKKVDQGGWGRLHLFILFGAICGKIGQQQVSNQRRLIMCGRIEGHQGHASNVYIAVVNCIQKLS